MKSENITFGIITKIWLILTLAAFTYSLFNDWIILSHLKAKSNQKFDQVLPIVQIIILIGFGNIIATFILLVNRKKFAFWMLVFLSLANFSINLRLDIPLSEAAVGLIGIIITWLFMREHWEILR